MAGNSPVMASDEQRAGLLALAGPRDRGEADRARAVLLTLAGWTSSKTAEAFGSAPRGRRSSECRAVACRRCPSVSRRAAQAADDTSPTTSDSRPCTGYPSGPARTPPGTHHPHPQHRGSPSPAVREDTVRLWRSDFMRGGVAALKTNLTPGPAPEKSEAALRVVTPLLEEHVADRRNWTIPGCAPRSKRARVSASADHNCPGRCK